MERIENLVELRNFLNSKTEKEEKRLIPIL